MKLAVHVSIGYGMTENENRVKNLKIPPEIKKKFSLNFAIHKELFQLLAAYFSMKSQNRFVFGLYSANMDGFW